MHALFYETGAIIKQPKTRTVENCRFQVQRSFECQNSMHVRETTLDIHELLI